MNLPREKLILTFNTVEDYMIINMQDILPVEDELDLIILVLMILIEIMILIIVLINLI